MTQQTVLTEAQRTALCAQYLAGIPLSINHFILKVEQAVLQSPEVQAMRWQPIDTAPMNGSTILIGRFNSNGKWRTMRGQWMSKSYIDEYWEEPDGAEQGWFETAVEADDAPNCWRIVEPTHWMPLPAPPADSAMEKQK